MNKPEILEKAEDFSARLKQTPIIAAILTKLEEGLSKELYYHSPNHTLDVLHEAILFGIHDKLEDHQLTLLGVAAAFHDSGFLKGRDNHETRGAELARAMMTQDGNFTEKEIEQVVDMIIDTRLIHTLHGRTQIPSTNLSGYLLDADLSNFGREDFFEKSELQRREWGSERDAFLAETLKLISSHEWITPAAGQLRQQMKQKNIARLLTMVQGGPPPATEDNQDPIKGERLEFLARLPLLINNTLEKRKVIKISVEYAKKMVDAEAATIFLKEHGSQDLVFWAPQGGDDSRLQGKRMPATKRIVGWVLEHQQPIVVKDVNQDPRFFSQIDKEGGFVTKNLICVPLTVRGSTKLGALQILNKKGTKTFDEQDILFIEQFANQLALAIDNAQLHQQVVRRNEQLEELGHRKSEMLRVLSHELKTLVTIIQSAAELLSGGMLTDEASISRIKDTLNKGVERITKVSQQLNNVAFLGDNTTIQKSSFEIDSLLREVTKQFAEIARERNLLLEVSADSQKALVSADKSLIYLALSNLVSNAIRFTNDHGSVTLVCKVSAGMAAVSVLDTGIGMDESQQSLIFEKFYEVADAKHHSSGDFEFRSGALGLGLASVKTILEAHHASITVESTPDKGSCFTFHLQLLES